MAADSLLEDARKALPGCSALGFSALGAGTLLMAAATDTAGQRALVTVARASGDLFEGSRVVLPSGLCKREGQPETDASFEVLIVESSNGAKYLFRCASDRAFVAIVHSDTDPAQVLRCAKSILPPLVPQLSGGHV